MFKKLLTIPFFIGLLIIPIGVWLAVTTIPKVHDLLWMYGEWSFKQWEQK